MLNPFTVPPIFMLTPICITITIISLLSRSHPNILSQSSLSISLIAHSSLHNVVLGALPSPRRLSILAFIVHRLGIGDYY